MEQLIPFGSEKMSPERQKEISAKGGRARAAAIRRRKSLRESAEVFLSLPVREEPLQELVKGLKKDDQTYQMAIIAALVKKAAEGDAKAAKLVFDLIGEESRADRGVTILVDI